MAIIIMMKDQHRSCLSPPATVPTVKSAMCSPKATPSRDYADQVQFLLLGSIDSADTLGASAALTVTPQLLSKLSEMAVTLEVACNAIADSNTDMATRARAAVLSCSSIFAELLSELKRACDRTRREYHLRKRMFDN